MSYRKKMSRKIDKKVFSNTASRTKKINLTADGMRGGIRL